MKAPSPPKPIYAPPGTRPDALPGEDLRPVLLIATARRRLVGRLLDICAVASSAVLIFLPGAYIPLVLIDDSSTTLTVTMIVALFLTIGTAFVVLRIGLVAWWGCTAGQRIAGMRIVEYPDGTPARGWRLALRRWFILRGGHSSLGPLSDLSTMLGDSALRQCDHDEQAGTVVIVARPPAEAVPHVWAASERTRRILLGTALGLAVSVVLAVVVLKPLHDKIKQAQGLEFTVETFYEDEPHFVIRRPNGRAETFDRTAGRVRNSGTGCLAAAANGRVRELLARLGCKGRIEVAFRTSDRVVVASGHLLRFADTAAATRASGYLRWTDLRFVPGGPVDPPGKISGGRLDQADRYVVVTSVVAPKGPGMQEKAKNALILLHAPTVNVINILTL